ncbi:hypothetical protein H7F15_12575 [Pontibacter sp. Tf4]|uniref:hypothetical protein n=1 Tax=Pontibacter sp. Tf4 TaxID=2761620 RepID=UPI001624451A|nr:hypothetical protein [Pontibacter sp. Tf4]MBB6611878.1 hypothetical protein [Pontibacter sp. Tf4]
MLEYSMFERLPFRSQAEVIAKTGTIVASRRYGQWHVTLFALNDRFVELWSGEQAQVFSTFKEAASKIAIFEPYLNEVNIGELER